MFQFLSLSASLLFSPWSPVSFYFFVLELSSAYICFIFSIFSVHYVIPFQWLWQWRWWGEWLDFPAWLLQSASISFRTVPEGREHSSRWHHAAAILLAGDTREISDVRTGCTWDITVARGLNSCGIRVLTVTDFWHFRDTNRVYVPSFIEVGYERPVSDIFVSFACHRKLWRVPKIMTRFFVPLPYSRFFWCPTIVIGHAMWILTSSCAILLGASQRACPKVELFAVPPSSNIQLYS